MSASMDLGLLVGAADDLMDPLVAQPDDLRDGPKAHRRGGFADRCVAFLAGVGVALDGALESFRGVHESESSLLDKRVKKSRLRDMSRTQTELLEAAAAKRDQAATIAASAGVNDTAATRLNAHNLRQAHRSTDSQLRRYTEATAQAARLEHKAALAGARDAEKARERFTSTDELQGATHIQDSHGWHEVVRINAKTVTVKTPYSWTDSIALNKIRAGIDRPGNRIIKPGETPR